MTKVKLVDLVRAEKARPGVGETPLYLLHVIYPEQKRRRCWHRVRVREDMGRLRQVVGDLVEQAVNHSIYSRACVLNPPKFEVRWPYSHAPNAYYVRLDIVFWR